MLVHFHVYVLFANETVELLLLAHLGGAEESIAAIGQASKCLANRTHPDCPIEAELHELLLLFLVLLLHSKLFCILDATHSCMMNSTALLGAEDVFTNLALFLVLFSKNLEVTNVLKSLAL